MNKIAALAAVLALLSCKPKPEPLPEFGFVSQFQLTGQDGQPFDSSRLLGKIWVADFIFTTCPGPCPRMTSQMHQVQQATEKMQNIGFVSFTVDPAHDVPAVLAAYAKLHHADQRRWMFLTGPQETLNHLCRNVFKLGNVDGSLQHSTRFVLMDYRSHIRGYYDTSEPDSIPKLVSDIHVLAGEHS